MPHPVGQTEPVNVGTVAAMSSPNLCAQHAQNPKAGEAGTAPCIGRLCTHRRSRRTGCMAQGLQTMEVRICTEPETQIVCQRVRCPKELEPEVATFGLQKQCGCNFWADSQADKRGSGEGHSPRSLRPSAAPVNPIASTVTKQAQLL